MINFKLFFEILRIHHWIKNLLLFVPLITAHQFMNIDLIIVLSIAFVAFSFCASSIYIFNDIFDIDNDRAHPNKKNRPFAANKISKRNGIFCGVILLILSFLISSTINHTFSIFLLIYLVTSFLYSIYLKKLKYLDCLILVGFYVLRIFSGGIIINIIPSLWLVIFSFFIFLSLAFIKRYIELNLHYNTAEAGIIPGRKYSFKDKKKIYLLGIISGLVSTLTLAIYLGSDTVVQLYKSPIFIWIAIPILFFWIILFWKKAKNKQIYDDPIVHAIKDKNSLVLFFLFFLCFVVAKFY